MSIQLNAHAEEWRLQGNTFIKKGKEYSTLAAVCYSIAICTSNNKANLALAYANRSVALMTMGFHKEALKDCFVAIEHKYPEDKIDKIYLRIISCSIETKESPSVFENAIEKLNEWCTIHNKDKYTVASRFIDKNVVCMSYLFCYTFQSNFSKRDTKY